MSQKKNSNSQLEKMRHSCEHVLTQAMLKLYPGIKMAMGPATDEGFYFDFDPGPPAGGYKISEADFPKIEKEMQKIILLNLPIKKEKLSIEKARKLFKGNQYKQEWLDEIALRQAQGKKEKAVVYWTGPSTGSGFVDLCGGPHLKSTGEIGFFKLLSIAGAYWRGDEKKKMLTRIYGTCFPTKKQLDEYLKLQKEAKERDHRKLGVQLDLFVIDKHIGKGLPLLTTKGNIIREEILSYERKLEKEAGFLHVWTPHIARSELYKRTGHWQHYRETMYAPFGIDGEEYVLKPMNCPHHYAIYASRQRSYKELPVRITEAGTCYRYEKSGELAGLIRVRALTIDDAHILMAEDQIEQEFNLCIRMIKKMFKALGIKDSYVRLSINDPAEKIKFIADKKTWDEANKKLEKILKNGKTKYVVEKGEASFYGPKIDYMVKDSLGREWQMSTLQLDLFMAKRLNLTYIDKEGKKQHPVILHRGLTGSIERTIGLLIEHYGGAFPVWLAPVQAIIIPVTDRHNQYGKKVTTQLRAGGVRANTDTRSDTVSAKIRDAEIQKIPYVLVVGDKEVRGKTVNVRVRGEKVLGSMSLKKFLDLIKENIAKKKQV